MNRVNMKKIERSNALWYWIVFESIVSSKNCIRRVIDFQISFRYTICSKFDYLFLIIKRKRLSCRVIDMIIKINCFIQRNAFTKRWTFHDIDTIVRVNCIVRKIEFVMQLIFKHVFVTWFDYDLLYDLFVIWSLYEFIFWFYFLSMLIFCNSCKNFKCLFLTKFFLIIISSKNKTTFYFNSYVINNIANFSRIICMFDLFLKNFARNLNDDIFFELCIFCKRFFYQSSIVLCDVRNYIDVVFYMTEKNHKILCLCEIFSIFIFVNAQFMFYFLIVCYEIHVKLIHINSRRNETIVYFIIYHEMFVRNFLIHVCSNFVKIFCNDIIFCNVWFYAC